MHSRQTTREVTIAYSEPDNNPFVQVHATIGVHEVRFVGKGRRVSLGDTESFRFHIEGTKALGQKYRRDRMCLMMIMTATNAAH